MKKKQRIKKALVSSALALILCVSMLVGNTFAWFTDTASTSVNRIQAGTLDVDLEQAIAWDEDGKVTEWESVDGKTLEFVKAADGKEQTILWEPGCTYSLPTVKVVNNGSLALKYTVQINGVVGNDEDDVDLSEVLELYVNGQVLKTTDGEVVTLKDALTSQDPDGFAHGNLEAGKDSGELTISLHMQETAGNEYQGKTIRGISVTVYATQDTVEYDSTTNQYDKDAEYVVEVSTIDELRSEIAKNSGAKIVLANDISLSSDELVSAAYYNETGKCILSIGNSADIDLNGHSLSYTKTGDSDETCEFGLYIKENATVNIYDSSANKTGTISIDNKANKGWLVCAIAHPTAAGVTVNLYGGNYTSSNEAVIYSQTQNAHINIYGGTYSTSDSNKSLLLNVYNGRGYIDIYGGSFKEFNPGVTNGSETKVADGYTVVQSGGWYSVVPNN